MKHYHFLILLIALSSKAMANYDEVADNTYRKLNNSVTIQVIPSSYPLNWKTSRGLILSLIKNKYFFPKTNAVLGHVTAEVNCTIDGKKLRKFSGQKVKDLNGFRNHVLNGYGFSVLNRPRNNYKDLPLLTIEGELDHYSDSLIKINHLIEKNHFSSVSFKINEESCKKAIDFIQNYEKITNTSKRAGNQYGFGANPRKFEGAGCASYVETILEFAGIKDLNFWLNQKVYIPNSFLGDIEKNKKVSIWKLLMSSETLKYPRPGFREFIFPDPQVIYDKVQLIGKNIKVPDHFKILFNERLGPETFVLGLDVLD